MTSFLSNAARTTAVVGAGACAVWASGMLLGVEAAMVTGVIITASASALFGDTSDAPQQR
jgi:hypothetical protein